jgi:rubrerythrin
MGYKQPTPKMPGKMMQKQHQHMGMGHMEQMEEECCPDNPDLLLLRDAAVDERTAIAFYLRAAKETCLTDLFLHVARDEMRHFVMVMHHITMLDSVQAEALEEMDLDALVMRRGTPKWEQCSCPTEDTEADTCEDSEEQEDEELDTIDYLTKALTGELQAINKYQTYMEKAECEQNQRLFCHLMNDEKEHVAEFTAALFKITNEPVMMDDDDD